MPKSRLERIFEILDRLAARKHGGPRKDGGPRRRPGRRKGDGAETVYVEPDRPKLGEGGAAAALEFDD